MPRSTTRTSPNETTRARSSTRPTPLYAAVGAGDLVVEKIRHTSLERESQRLQESIEVRVNQRVAEVKAIPGQVRALPERAQAVAGEALGQVNEVYADLANRGEVLVARIRGQESTKAATRQARNTTSQAKGTTTSARRTAKKAQGAADETAQEVKKAAQTTRRSTRTSGQGVQRSAKATQTRAKATTSSAHNTAETAAKAVSEAAEKVGD